MTALALRCALANIRGQYVAELARARILGPLHNPRQLGLSPEFFALYQVGLPLVVTLTFIAVAILIFWRKSDDWMALWVSLTLIALGVSYRFALSDLDTLWPPVAFAYRLVQGTWPGSITPTLLALS